MSTETIIFMPNQPKSMHCDWGMMRDEANWSKTDGVAELRGRLDKIREGFEAAIEAPMTHERQLAELRFASAQLSAQRETEFAAIDEAIATHRAAANAVLEAQVERLREALDSAKAWVGALRVPLPGMLKTQNALLYEMQQALAQPAAVALTIEEPYYDEENAKWVYPATTPEGGAR